MDRGAWQPIIDGVAGAGHDLATKPPPRYIPDSSVGKESICNAGDPVLIPGLERSAGEGISYPLQYSWTSLVAQLVKNPSAMQENPVQFLGREDLLEKG